MSTPSEDPLRLTIVLMGFPPDVEHDDAVARVQKAFGTNLATAERFIENIPVVVKRGATRETARAYVQTLHKIGAQVEVRREPPPDEAALQESGGHKESSSGARAAIGRLNTVSISRQTARPQAPLQIPGKPSSRPTRRTSPESSEAQPDKPVGSNPVETEFASPPSLAHLKAASPLDLPPLDDRIDLDDFDPDSLELWNEPIIATQFAPLSPSPTSNEAAPPDAPPLDDVYPEIGSNPWGDLPEGGWDPSVDASEQHLDLLAAHKAKAHAHPSSVSIQTRLEAPPPKIARSAAPSPSKPANPLDALLIHHIDADALPDRHVAADAGITVDGVWPPEDDDDAFIVEQNAISGDVAPSGVADAGFQIERGIDDDQPSLEALLYDNDPGELQRLDPLAGAYSDDPPPLSDDALDPHDAHARAERHQPLGGLDVDDPAALDERDPIAPRKGDTPEPEDDEDLAPSAPAATSPASRSPGLGAPASTSPEAAPVTPRRRGADALDQAQRDEDGATPEDRTDKKGEGREPPPRVLTPARSAPRPVSAAAPARAFWPTVPRAMVAPFLGGGILWLPIMAALLAGALFFGLGSGLMLAGAVALLMVTMVAQASSFSRAATQALHGDLSAPKLGFDREDLLKGGVLMTIFALLFFALPIWLGSGLITTGDAARDVALASQDPSRTQEWSPEEAFFDAAGARVLFLPNTPANVAFTKEGKKVLVDPSRRQIHVISDEKGGDAGGSAEAGFPIARFALFLLLLAGALYCWPMMLTILSLSTRTSAIFNPVYLARTIKAGGARYGFISGVGIVLVTTSAGVAIGMAASGALSLSPGAGSDALLPGLGALLTFSLLTGYAFIAQGQLVGVMIAETPELFEDFHRGFVAGP